MIRIPLTERARGHWQSILPALGIDKRFLTKRNGPCPMCGGKDRWRFTDLNGKGTWFCNHCAGGNGVALALKFTGMPFKDLAPQIERIIGSTSAEPKLPQPSTPNKEMLNRLWRSGRPVCADDPIDRWLRARGIELKSVPTCLRFSPNVRHSGPPVSWHPAMLAMVTDATGLPATLHKTYVAIDGNKADVDKVRMFCPGARPIGGAVRLAPAGPTLGVAEGIETALAAMKLFDVPTWSALDAGGMEKFEPPAEVTKLVVFGDNDENGRGQQAAHGLAARLAGRVAVEVRVPDQAGTDWNDVLLGGGAGEVGARR